MLAAVAAGVYLDLAGAAERMVEAASRSYQPDARAHTVYQSLYGEYLQLHDYFGRGANDVMKRLKQIKYDVLAVKG